MGSGVFPVERRTRGCDAAFATTSKAAAASPTEAAEVAHPAPSEEDIARLTRLGMRPSGVESWFEMTAHPYTLIAVFLSMVLSKTFWYVFIFIVSVPLHIRASWLIFALPASIALFAFLVLMTLFWVFGPRAKLKFSYRVVHVIQWSAVAFPLCAFSVVEEEWAPFQSRVLSAIVTPMFFFTCVFLSIFADPFYPRVRLDGSLRGLACPLLYST